MSLSFFLTLQTLVLLLAPHRVAFALPSAGQAEPWIGTSNTPGCSGDANIASLTTLINFVTSIFVSPLSGDVFLVSPMMKNVRKVISGTGMVSTVVSICNPPLADPVYPSTFGSPVLPPTSARLKSPYGGFMIPDGSTILVSDRVMNWIR
eukprot:PhF_6_TR38632/c0_g2_i2/m.57638